MRDLGLRRKSIRWWRAESGATALEYVFVASLISIVILLGVTSVGRWVLAEFAAFGNAF